MSLNGKAPAFFRKCNKQGVPIYCLAVVSLISCVAFLNAKSSTSTVLNWFINLSAISLLLTYMVIFFSYIRFRKAIIAQCGSTDVLPFVTPFNLQPYVSWVGLSFCSVVIFFNGFYIFWPGAFNASDFLTAYFGLPAFAVCYVGWRLYTRTHLVKPEDADLWSGKEAIDRQEQEWVARQEAKARPKKWYDPILNFLF